MADADDGGLRVGPYVPESGVEPTDGSTENAVTEIIPAVPGESSSADAKVRGTARRSAAALPALGRKDGPSKVPRSSRSTLDRRERQHKAGSGGTTDQDAGRKAGAEREPRPEPVNPFASRPPRPRTPLDDALDVPEARVAIDDTAEIGDTAEIDMALGPGDGATRIRSGLVWTEESSDEGASDEGRRGLKAPDPARAERAQGGRERAQRGAERAQRGRERAPTSTDSDTWDREPTGDLAIETYHGRRRAPRRATRLALVGALAVLVVGALFGIPYVLRSSPTPPGPDAADPGTRPALPLALPTTTPDEGEISSTAGPGASTTPARTAGRTPTPTSGIAQVEDPTIQPTTPPPTTLPAFQPLTVEAEAGANSVISPAERSSYSGSSGGRIVGFLGVTQDRPGQGRLVISGVSVPNTDTYTVTFHYIANSNRTAHIIVNGSLADTVAVSARTNCCGTASLNVTLQQGTNTIEFTNPSARCPAIDRIVITRP